jgi:hypothetical protein
VNQNRETERRVNAEKLQKLGSQIFQKVGVPKGEADLVSKTLKRQGDRTAYIDGAQPRDKG